MSIYYIAIGNSDDKLTQQKWHYFANDLERLVLLLANEIHFVGFTAPNSPWQTMLICCDVHAFVLDQLYSGLKGLCSSYGQDSIALTPAHDTMFISATKGIR